jgi:hypothetical protein
MATPFAPPRTRMGIGPLPLPGDENPYLSSTQQQRFQNAGLQSFLPYADPFATVARARGYQNMERNMANEDQMYDAEQGFMEAVRQDPQTGYQKFLQQNPLATMSPMVRAYLVSQRQFQPQQDKYAQNVAEMGTPYLQTYQKSRGAGKTDLEAFAEAVSQREADELRMKPSKVADDRANLTGEPAERLAGIMSEIYETPEPTDDEKKVYLPKDKAATEADWTRAYYQAKEKKRQEAMGKLRAFQATYGEMFKVPGTGRSVSTTPASAPTSQPEQALAPDPFAGLTTYGDSKAVPAPAGAVQAPAVAPATVTSPVVPEAPVAAADLKRVEPVPAPTEPKTDTGFNFPTLGDDMEQGPVTKAINQGSQAVSNITSNVKFDPLQSLAMATVPGGMEMLAAKPAPTTEQQDQEWTSAKQKVRDFIASIPGDDQQKLKVLGSIVTEQSIPHDFFTKKKAGDGRIAYISAGSALQNAMREADPKLGTSALKDAAGVKEWRDVARVVAQEEMAKRGLIKVPGISPVNAPVKVSSLDEIRKLPVGSAFDYNGQIRTKTKEVP